MGGWVRFVVFGRLVVLVQQCPRCLALLCVRFCQGDGASPCVRRVGRGLFPSPSVAPSHHERPYVRHGIDGRTHTKHPKHTTIPPPPRPALRR